MAGARALATLSIGGDNAFDDCDNAHKAALVRQSKAVLETAFNYDEPYTSEDEKYDFARRTTDEINGIGTYAELNRHNVNPMVQRAIRRFYKEMRGD
jgi:hypothetical protein